MQESEFEDVLNFEIYGSAIEDKFVVYLDKKEIRNSGKKWYERVKDVFSKQGKLWNDKTEAEVNAVVAECVKQQPTNALNQHKRSSIDSLVLALEDVIR